MAEAGNGIRPSCDDPTSAAGRMYESVMNPDDLPHDIETTYVARKEDMTYEELCTLEGMIALFNHDESLDKEIANLKEDCLLNIINELEAKLSYYNMDEMHNATKFKEALMLMTYIHPEDIPEDDRERIINAAIETPSILLTYIDKDVELLWPVRNATHGTGYAGQLISHGLKNDMSIEDAMQQVNKTNDDMEDA